LNYQHFKRITRYFCFQQKTRDSRVDKKLK